MNTFVTAHLCRGLRCEQAVELFCQRFHAEIPVQPFLQFLRLADDAIRHLLYIPELAERKLFFRRLRVPPFSHIFWDRIVINASMRTLLRALVTDRQRAIEEGRLALQHLETMRQMATTHGLPKLGLDLQYDTFEILATARDYLLGEVTPDLQKHLRALLTQYHEKHPWKSIRGAIPSNSALPPASSRLAPCDCSCAFCCESSRVIG